MSKQLECKCTGKAGQTIQTNGCEIHTKEAYSCDFCGKSKCPDYKPISDFNPARGSWPACICGHLSEDHN